MIISILTLFPQVFTPIQSFSIIGRAQKKNLVTIRIVDIRDFATDKHRSVDDKPYGGGVGMIMRVDIVERAISKVKSQNSKFKSKQKVILLDPTGRLFNQSKARQFSKLDHLILVSGHYEGIDERIHHFVDESVSIGRYILTGGEIAAMVVTDAVVRLIPRVLKKSQAIKDESYSIGKLIESPHYTRPPIYKGYKVPEILISGNHAEIAKWRSQQALIRTKERNN